MNILAKRFVFSVLLAGLVSTAQADGLLKVEQTVFGMDCAPCAYGLQKGLSKLPGAKHVDVSLNEGKAVVEFSPDSPATLSQIREVVLHGGWTPKDAAVTVSGHVATEGGQLFLVTGPARYRLVIPQSVDAASIKIGAEVTLQGLISAAASADPAPTLQVQQLLTGA